jgi:hypothetical protein
MPEKRTECNVINDKPGSRLHLNPADLAYTHSPGHSAMLRILFYKKYKRIFKAIESNIPQLGDPDTPN